MKILVAEPLAPAAIELLRAQRGWEVIVADPKTYQAHLADCDALLVRSAVKVTKRCWPRRPSYGSSDAPAWASTTSIYRLPQLRACW